MALMKIQTFQKRFVKGDAPDTRTVQGWIDKGKVYGERYGRLYYIDPDRPPETTTSNELVLKVLAAQGNNKGANNGAASNG